jgi:2-polyprenyl-3-methyl-5-hydroxy-6-metoxy-1,4-benzoquinol methylase
MKHGQPLLGINTTDGYAINERRRRMVQPLAGNVLDFGCGDGLQTSLLAAPGVTLYGVDVQEDQLSAARDRGIYTFLYRDVLLFERAKNMDTVVSFDALEHTQNELEALDVMRQLLRPFGVLKIIVPNRWWMFETHQCQIGAWKFRRLPFVSWLPTRWHDRLAGARIYSKRRIVALLYTVGFTVTDVQYVTAPMDVVKPQWLKKLLRALIFRGDTTCWPFLATAIYVRASRWK